MAGSVLSCSNTDTERQKPGFFLDYWKTFLIMFVVIFLVGNLKYYVQEFKGEYRLNGLSDNAIKFTDEVDVIEAVPWLETILNKHLLPMELKTKNNEIL